MSTSAAQSSSAISDPGVAKVDMKFELVIIPFSDVDRAKKFYQGLG